jgi:hypothetical protein
MIDYDRLYNAALMAGEAESEAVYQRLMQIATRTFGPLSGELPVELRPHFADARACWLMGEPIDLEPARIHCWQYLKDHGITYDNFRENRLTGIIRILICLLYSYEASLATTPAGIGEASDNIAWFFNELGDNAIQLALPPNTTADSPGAG